MIEPESFILSSLLPIHSIRISSLLHGWLRARLLLLCQVLLSQHTLGLHSQEFSFPLISAFQFHVPSTIADSYCPVLLLRSPGLLVIESLSYFSFDYPSEKKTPQLSITFVLFCCWCYVRPVVFILEILPPKKSSYIFLWSPNPRTPTQAKQTMKPTRLSERFWH